MQDAKYYYGEKSMSHFATLAPALQSLCLEIVKHRDCTILCGHRSRPDQEAAVAAGTSRLHFPDSLHNRLPSFAVDLVPYPRPDWEDIQAFRDFGFFVLGVAAAMNIPLRWGADWNKNYLVEKGENDFVHFELLTVQAVQAV